MTVAEFQEVMRQFDRMCWHYQRKRKCPMECPMNGVNISQCRKIAFEEPDVTEKTVMSWAAEHPEPVYPTWGEWLEKQDVVKQVRSPRYEEDGESYYTPLSKIEDHIPPDIAQMLGIEPVPVVHGDCGATNEADARKKLGIEPLPKA